MKTRIKEKKSAEQIQAEKEADRRARRQQLRNETDPELKAAELEALEAREALDEAEKRVRDADDELDRLKSTKHGNLDEEDQGAIQGATQSGVETVR